MMRSHWPTAAVKGWGGVAALLIVHITVWTLAAVIGGASGNVHHDMLEAWDWGREWQWGYAKHPPVFAWVAGLWFLLFPRTDWAFYLLSAFSAAGGLAGVWCLAGRILPRPQQTAALLLVILAPFFSVLAITFNGNAILLLIWPWTAYAYVRSVQTGTLGDGVLFGAFAAVAMLSKYSSILLLASCLTSALLHPRARAYFAGPAPYAAIATCLLVMLPHILWVFDHGLTTVTYVLEKEHLALPKALAVAATSMLASLALNGLPMIAVWAVAGRDLPGLLSQAAGGAVSPTGRWLSVLALAPFVLTVLAGLVGGLTVSTNFLLPAFFMMPVALLALTDIAMGPERLTVLWRFISGWLLAALAIAPVAAAAAFVTDADQTVEPRREIAEAATRLWHEAFPQPLRISAGTDAYGLAVPFYSPDAPHLFLLDPPGATPWITPERIAREGLLIICEHTDVGCLARATGLMTPAAQRRSVSLHRTFLGWSHAGTEFDVFLIPPRHP